MTVVPPLLALDAVLFPVLAPPPAPVVLLVLLLVVLLLLFELEPSSM